MIPAARGLAGEIAELLGRPENEGWVFTRCFQDAKVFERGKPGGLNGSKAPRAETMHGVLLFLAMATGAPPRNAVADAASFVTMPFIEMRRYDLRPDGESFSLEAPSNAPPAIFGGMLAEVINWHRIVSPDGPAPLAVRFGISGNLQFGEIFIASVPREGDAGTPIIGLRYGVELEAAQVGPYPVHRFAEISGSILRDIAKLFGSAKSGGGIALTEYDIGDGDETEADELPMAAASIEPQAPEAI